MPPHPLRASGALVRLAAILLAGAALAALALGALLTAVADRGLPVRADAAPLPAMAPLASRSVVLAADGSELATLYEENRAPVALEEVPEVLVHAVVATEDQSFFRHEGVDLRGVLRALLTNAGRGEVDQGGSTITQQLVKNAYLSPEQTLERKVREAAMAVRLEDELGKQGILERYLNTVYFGASAYGVSAAAERYFGKGVAQLTVAESALLAGLIASPGTYDPFERPAAAEARRSHVIGRMVAEGYLDDEEAAAARAAPLPDAPAPLPAGPTTHFVEEVKRWLLADPRLGDTAQERYDAVFRGGLRIHTTLDPRAQRAAASAVEGRLPESPFTAALVAVDPRNGAVRAMVGGPGLAQLRYNLATQGRRQVGSTFKAVALAAAVEAGHSPEAVVDGTAPCSLELPPPQEPWSVENYGGSRGSVMTLREATRRSINCAYARLALEVGPERIASMAERLGVTTDVPAVPSLALGTASVSPLEVASVFATLAADGVRHTPYLVERVETASGRVRLDAEPDPARAVSPQVARTVTDVLRGVITAGTGRAADIGRAAAGKTGTNQEWRDAWFSGYVPQLAAVVWMGSPEGQVSMRIGGRGVTGGSYPAAIWRAFMVGALEGVPEAPFAAPDRAQWGRTDAIGEVPRPPERSAPPPRSGPEPGEDGGDDDRPGRGNGRVKRP